MMRMTRWLLVGVVAMMVSCTHGLDVQRSRLFAQPDGVPLKLNVYRAPAPEGERRPGMLVIHGGGWRFGARTQQGWYCRQFARHGYVVVTIDYRMMPKYPFPNCLHDAKAGVRWMRLHADELGIDPDRIVTFGASAGGHLAAFLAATTPEDGFEAAEYPGPSSAVCAAVCLYGAVDLTKYRDAPGDRFATRPSRYYIRKFAGDAVVRDGLDAYETASPISYVKPGMAPVFLAHGTGDQVVDYRQSEAFHERLKELGVPTELHLFDKRNHGFDYVHFRKRQALFEQMLRFLDEHIPKSQ